MREILFRGKRLDNGEWVEGFYWCEYARRQNQHHIYTFDVGENEEVIITGNIIVDPLTVGQFTGLTDKNGKRAFEGDRIRYKDKYHNTYGVIKFGEIPHDFGNNGKHIGFYLEWENDGANEWDAWLRHDISFWISERECEIIGTIYDKEVPQ